MGLKQFFTLASSISSNATHLAMSIMAWLALLISSVSKPWKSVTISSQIFLRTPFTRDCVTSAHAILMLSVAFLMLKFLQKLVFTVCILDQLGECFPKIIILKSGNDTLIHRSRSIIQEENFKVQLDSLTVSLQFMMDFTVKIRFRQASRIPGFLIRPPYNRETLLRLTLVCWSLFWVIHHQRFDFIISSCFCLTAANSNPCKP